LESAQNSAAGQLSDNTCRRFFDISGDFLLLQIVQSSLVDWGRNFFADYLAEQKLQARGFLIK
jgi:hypothetical protein